MTNAHIDHFSQETENILQYLVSEFAKLQTGRASAALVEHVDVVAYGQHQQLKTIAGITVQDARTIVIQPWDKDTLRDIEVALQDADLGVTPQNDGIVIRLNLPPMTEERRQQIVKVVHQMAEEARISVRQQRQTAHDRIKDEEKDEDVRFTDLDILQKKVDDANAKIEDLKKQKEQEVMTV